MGWDGMDGMGWDEMDGWNIKSVLQFLKIRFYKV